MISFIHHIQTGKRKFFILLFWLTTIVFQSSPQNLVPNPGFEMFSSCPTWLNTGVNFTIDNWMSRWYC